MRIRRVAILIDGGFFEKRLPKLVPEENANTPDAIAKSAKFLCKRHIQILTGEPFSSPKSKWLDHVVRLFYFDARPFSGKTHHPLTGQHIDFGKSDTALFHMNLHHGFRKARKFALRLGEVTKSGGWTIAPSKTKEVIQAKKLLPLLKAMADKSFNPERLSEDTRATLLEQIDFWEGFSERDIRYDFRQKGVDMRLGLTIAHLALKQQVDTIVLVAGDSDFVPAAKLARREGIEFILDPLWHNSISDDLAEHVDAITSGFPAPNPRTGIIDKQKLIDKEGDIN